MLITMILGIICLFTYSFTYSFHLLILDTLQRSTYKLAGTILLSNVDICSVKKRQTVHFVTCCLVLMGRIIHGNREANQEQHHCHCGWKQGKRSQGFRQQLVILQNPR